MTYLPDFAQIAHRKGRAGLVSETIEKAGEELARLVQKMKNSGIAIKVKEVGPSHADMWLHSMERVGKDDYTPRFEGTTKQSEAVRQIARGLVEIYSHAALSYHEKKVIANIVFDNATEQYAERPVFGSLGHVHRDFMQELSR